MKLITSLLLLLTWKTSANAIFRSALDAEALTSIQNDRTVVACRQHGCATRSLSKRTVRTKCSPPKYLGHQRRSNSNVPGQSDNNATLWRRMRLPTDPDNDGGIEAYIMRETGENGDAEPVIWPDYVVGNDGKVEEIDVNTALYHDLTAERSIAAVRLQGCTALAVIGRKGVYFGHYWESISFEPDQKNLDDENETAEAAFQRTVLDALENGVQESGKVQQDSLTKFAQDLGNGDDHIRAYLIRPTKSFSQDNEEGSSDDGNDSDTGQPTDGYPQHWERMRAMVVKILPKIGEPGRWQEVKYKATSKHEELTDQSRGRLLFKFDPVHKMAQSRRDKDTRLAMLWSEQREIHRDEWQGS